MQYVITDTKSGQFFLTPNGLATDIFGNAQMFTDEAEAKRIAERACLEVAWSRYGFGWRACPVLEAVMKPVKVNQSKAWYERKHAVDDKACMHNQMVERKGDDKNAWQCADCGYVF